MKAILLLSVCALATLPFALAACNSTGAHPSSFTIGGEVVNLAVTGGGLVLQDNLKDKLPVNANGSFAFAGALASGASYNVTILSQPSNPAQTCSVVNGSGAATANVTDVLINCGHNEWAWEAGAATVNPDAVYGNLGVSSGSNTPGGRQLPLTWIDTSGNLWLFGGYAFQNNVSSYSLMNDLWKYGAGEWTWVGGSNTGGQSGSYGTLHMPAADTFPGGRDEGVSWTDVSGNFWLFGGNGYDSAGTIGRLNDLWKYSGGEWTWVAGSNLAEQRGVYGSLGVPAPNNVPGARIGAVSWTDSSGNLWLFGGFGLDSTGTNGPLNDLWEFRAGQWMWVAGSNYANQSGVYGTQGVPTPDTVPGARYSATGWTDLSGNLWLFGGQGTNGLLNDLWKYTNGQWTWISGSQSADQPGVYGSLGVSSPSNVPGARQTAVSWNDPSGNFWLFGGNAIDSANGMGLLNDLWKYSNGEWTWMSGAKLINQHGVYGTQGKLGPGNIPGARLQMCRWVDSNGNLWLFGGYGVPASGSEGNLNDLWMYMP